MAGHISGLDSRMVLDSRGQPTVEVDCFVDGKLMGRAIVPSGASTGAYEALELRDGDASTYLGKGVTKAVNNVKDHLEEALVGLPVDEQRVIDEVMIELDGTPNKSNLGANAMLGASMACLHAGAAFHELPLWKYFLPGCIKRELDSDSRIRPALAPATPVSLVGDQQTWLATRV